MYEYMHVYINVYIFMHKYPYLYIQKIHDPVNEEKEAEEVHLYE
jgi:hypothetical protein